VREIRTPRSVGTEGGATASGDPVEVETELWSSHYADSGGSRPRIRDDVAHHSEMMSPGVPR